METIRNRNCLIGLYITVLFLLLLSVSATPLLIRHGISLTHRFFIEEGTLETALIVTLFGISFMILKGFMNALKAYQRIVDRTGKEKSELISTLAEAFSYIGTVNVEIQEIESVLCGLTHYPKSKREFRQHIEGLAAKAMTVAAVPWIVVRMIERHSGHTVHEHAVQRPHGGLPPVTMGNRAILDGVPVTGLQTVGTRQRNLDLLTVFIMPKAVISKEETFLLTAILNQIEMLFIIYSAGCIKPMLASKNTAKETGHDSDH